MVPAPAQGAMVVVAMENDDFCSAALAKLNHPETEICTHIERQFLKTLEGGCTAPIGALATFSSDKIDFEGVLFSLDGKEKHTIKKSCTFDSFKNFGKKCAEEILNSGGMAIMESIRRDLKK
jgi:hydroxymethylbilane synthase